MYTRKQLSQKYLISQSRLRRILKVLQIQPVNITKNKKGADTYLYDQTAIQQINKYLDALKQHLNRKYRSCCICKKKLQKSQLICNRCPQCFIKRCCNPIVYGKQAWKKVVNSSNIQKAIDYLKNFVQT